MNHAQIMEKAVDVSHHISKLLLQNGHILDFTEVISKEVADKQYLPYDKMYWLGKDFRVMMKKNGLEEAILQILPYYSRLEELKWCYRVIYDLVEKQILALTNYLGSIRYHLIEYLKNKLIIKYIIPDALRMLEEKELEGKLTKKIFETEVLYIIFDNTQMFCRFYQDITGFIDTCYEIENLSFEEKSLSQDFSEQLEGTEMSVNDYLRILDFWKDHAEAMKFYQKAALKNKMELKDLPLLECSSVHKPFYVSQCIDVLSQKRVEFLAILLNRGYMLEWFNSAIEKKKELKVEWKKEEQEKFDQLLRCEIFRFFL